MLLILCSFNMLGYVQLPKLLPRNHSNLQQKGIVAIVHFKRLVGKEVTVNFLASIVGQQ